MSVLISLVLILAGLSILFLVFGPAMIAFKRPDGPSDRFVFVLTLLTLPTVIGWPVVLAYALFGKSGEKIER